MKKKMFSEAKLCNVMTSTIIYFQTGKSSIIIIASIITMTAMAISLFVFLQRSSNDCESPVNISWKGSLIQNIKNVKKSLPLIFPFFRPI